jgi:hypothetical protein
MSDFLDMGGIKHRLNAFDAQHGASVMSDGWIIFEDGAVRETNPLGALVDPPTSAWDLARRKLQYHKIIFQRAMRKFDDAKAGYLALAHANLNSSTCGPAASVEEVTRELKGLQQKAREAKANYDRALADVEAAKPRHLRNVEQANIENRRSNELLLDSIKKIEF